MATEKKAEPCVCHTRGIVRTAGRERRRHHSGCSYVQEQVAQGQCAVPTYGGGIVLKGEHVFDNSGCCVYCGDASDAASGTVADPLDDLIDPHAVRCPECGHMPHGTVCFNMASDNDCNCTAGQSPAAPDAEGAERCSVVCKDFPMHSCDAPHQCVKNAGHSFDPMFGEIHEFESHLIPAKAEGAAPPERIWVDSNPKYGYLDCSPEPKTDGIEYIEKSVADAEIDLLHIAICDAVGLLNAVVHEQSESRQAHNILRQALIDYADRAAARKELGE